MLVKHAGLGFDVAITARNLAPNAPPPNRLTVVAAYDAVWLLMVGDGGYRATVAVQATAADLIDLAQGCLELAAALGEDLPAVFQTPASWQGAPRG